MNKRVHLVYYVYLLSSEDDEECGGLGQTSKETIGLNIQTYNRMSRCMTSGHLLVVQVVVFTRHGLARQPKRR